MQRAKNTSHIYNDIQNLLLAEHQTTNNNIYNHFMGHCQSYINQFVALKKTYSKLDAFHGIIKCQAQGQSCNIINSDNVKVKMLKKELANISVITC